jgi:hypothetical protein
MIYEDDFIPAPETAHPTLEHQADRILDLFKQRGSVKVMKPVSSREPDRIENSSILQDVLVLRPKSYYGLAPYVGRPFVYVWDAVTDDVRWVAGPTRLVYIPEKRGGWQSN